MLFPSSDRMYPKVTPHPVRHAIAVKRRWATTSAAARETDGASESFFPVLSKEAQ
jgi:hypothetical protein